MRAKRALMAVLIIALMGAFLIPPNALALAQGTWTCTFDFTQGAGAGWEARVYQAPSWGSYYVAGVGWRNTTYYYNNSIKYPILTDGGTLQGVSFHFYGGNIPTERSFIALQNQFMGFLLNYGEYEPGPDTVTWTGSLTLHQNDDTLLLGVGGHQTNDALRVSTITWMSMWGTGTPPCTPDTYPEYESVPAAGGTVTVGAGPVGEQIVNSSAMEIENTGDAVLAGTLSLSGTNANEFEIVSSDDYSIAAGSSSTVQLACTPQGTGERSATLTVTSNDSDEATNTYNLTCNSSYTAPPPNLASCLALGDAATFRSGSDWSYFGAAGNPQGAAQGLSLPPASGASLALRNLSYVYQYQIDLRWHATNPSPSQHFTVALGESDMLQVAMPNDSQTHTFTIPAASYQPEPNGGYVLTLAKPFTEDDPGLVLDFICVSKRGDALNSAGGMGGAVGATYDAGECRGCEYAPTGDIGHDIGQIISWLGCFLRDLVECKIVVVVKGIWDYVNQVLVFLGSFRVWMEGTINAVSDVTEANIGNITGYFGGQFNNLFPGMSNALYDAGAADLQNQAVGAAVNGPRFLANALQSAGNAVTTTTTIGQAMNNPLVSIISAIGALIQMVPEFMADMLAGFNQGAYAPVSGSISCSNPGVILYYPCLGFYVADNTIFQGPAAFLIPILCAVMAWDTFTWAIWRFREAFSK